ncbi:MAG: type II toxin-antitoxin system RelE/ParE family toxin [Pseudomonadota bacterium]
MHDKKSLNNLPKYRDKRTKRFAEGERVKEFHAFKEQAERRLDILEVAESKNDLMQLPSNGFEALGGNRLGQFSIRINKQWRICFEWTDENERPFNIEITDYH